jgi:hypothetical protein
LWLAQNGGGVIDYDFHRGSFSGAVMDIKIDNNNYLYSFLVVEPAHSGITRHYKTSG